MRGHPYPGPSTSLPPTVTSALAAVATPWAFTSTVRNSGRVADHRLHLELDFPGDGDVLPEGEGGARQRCRQVRDDNAALRVGARRVRRG
jgi:hypothetical protein